METDLSMGGLGASCIYYLKKKKERFFSVTVYHRILNIVLCAIQSDLVYPFYVQ